MPVTAQGVRNAIAAYQAMRARQGGLTNQQEQNFEELRRIEREGSWAQNLPFIRYAVSAIVSGAGATLGKIGWNRMFGSDDSSDQPISYRRISNKPINMYKAMQRAKRRGRRDFRRKMRGAMTLSHLQKCVEYKRLDIGIDEIEASKDGLIKNMLIGKSGTTGIALGTGMHQRTGAKVLISSIHINFQVEAETASPEKCNWTRILLFIDKQANGTAPTVAQLLNQPAAVGSNHFQWHTAMRNPEFLNRFHILMDRSVYTAFDAAGGGSYCRKISFRKYFPSGHMVQYSNDDSNGTGDGDGGDTADIVRGGIWMIALGKYLPTQGNAKMSYEGRITYTD